MKSRCYCEISLSAIAHNVQEIKKLIHPSTKIMGIVKANGYGAGYYEVSKVLLENGVDFLAVATVKEAIELRKKNINADILIIGYTQKEEIALLEQYDLIQTVVSLEQAKQLQHSKIRTHLKIDTGMGRIGFLYRDNQKNTQDIIEAYQLLKNVEGIFSHFSVADSADDIDIAYTKNQINLFEELVLKLEKQSITFKYKHLQNSYGILNYPELKYDFVRPGILLLGAVSHSDFYNQSNINLKPALSWKSRVAQIKWLDENSAISYGRTFITNKKMKVATITVGYADGYPRSLSNKGYVLINGMRCNIVGRVCMDQMLVDVTNATVEVGDEVVLIGKSKDLEITIEQLAKLDYTITNQIFCAISARVERIYYD